MKNYHRFIQLVFTVIITLVVAGCATRQTTAVEMPPVLGIGNILNGINEKQIVSQPLYLAAEGIELLQSGKLDDASAKFNQALQLDTSNSYLHFLNGFTYHLQAVQGDGGAFDLAQQGYQLAIKFDATNWFAHYQLGLLYIDRSYFSEAQEALAEALIYNPEDPDLLYGMIIASYYAQDPSTAAAVLQQLNKLRPDAKKTIRATTIINAALNNRELALESLDRFKSAARSPYEYTKLAKRVDDWRTLYERYSGQNTGSTPKTILAAYSENTIDKHLVGESDPTASLEKVDSPFNEGIDPVIEDFFDESSEEITSNASLIAILSAYLEDTIDEHLVVESDPTASLEKVDSSFNEGMDPVIEEFYDESSEEITSNASLDSQQLSPVEEAEDLESQMVIVDVVIIRTEEQVSSSKGVNLLNGLQLQFGDTTNSQPALSHYRLGQYDSSNPSLGTQLAEKTITTYITIPAITYSLNIFNTQLSRNEILARPTLIALNGNESQFFSGTELKAAATGSGSDSAVEVDRDDIGVKLKITPEFLDDGRVKLQIYAQRTFLKQPTAESGNWTFKLETTNTNLTANIVMNFGETLILGGLSEKETGLNRDGVPFLQDIPGVQYLFSNSVDTEFQKSVLMLITPRKPVYVHADPEKYQKFKNDGRRLSELQSRYSDWFEPYPNIASVFHHMQDNKLYREFRTGDVELERWQSQQNLGNRLKQAMQFLYY